MLVYKFSQTKIVKTVMSVWLEGKDYTVLYDLFFVQIKAFHYV